MTKNGMILRFITAGLCAGLIVCPATLAGVQTDAADRQSHWKALAASGAVNAREALAPENEWFKIKRGDQLLPLSLVRTGRHGKATLGMQQHILIVRSNSELRLPDLEHADHDSQVYQDAGTVTYEVDGSSFERFEVVTPYLVAGVKGTVFTVTVTAGRATVSVEEGLVEVSSRFGDATVELFPGEEVSIDGTEIDGLEIRQVDGELRDATRRELQTARSCIERPVSDFPPTDDLARRQVSELDITGNASRTDSIAVSDSMGSQTEDLPQNDSAAGTVLDRELTEEMRRTLFEIERILAEEIKDLELRGAEVIESPPDSNHGTGQNGSGGQGTGGSDSGN